MIQLSTLIKHYKRRDVQEAMVTHTADREVAARYNEKFGSRPDIIHYPNDVLESAKQGATSFHCSEERWRNPLHLSTELRPRELTELRIGWDLVIDVDSKNWEFAKLISHSIVKVIKGFGITSVSVKFSGNKGFHIGVPFEAFPPRIHGKETKSLFPEGPKRIALYIIHLLEEKFFDIIPYKNPVDIADAIGVTEAELMIRICTHCNKKQRKRNTIEFICSNCDNRFKTAQHLNYKSCEKCKKLMTKNTQQESCIYCNRKEFVTKLDMERVLEIDTLLISSRHLYRAPYSLHEKSGLVSIPIDPNTIMEFKREYARPEKVITTYSFLSRTAEPDEARLLFLQAFDHTIKQQEQSYTPGEIKIPETAIAEEHFPTCIKKLGVLEDGKKRAMFILINFLRSVGWNAEQVEQYVRSWNKNHPEPLRENYLIGQLRTMKTKKPILPPNCANINYYQSLGCKCDDNICSRVKNPVNYAKRAAKYAQKGKRKTEKNTDKTNPKPRKKENQSSENKN
jgi:hypothetical protein